MLFFCLVRCCAFELRLARRLAREQHVGASTTTPWWPYVGCLSWPNAHSITVPSTSIARESNCVHVECPRALAVVASVSARYD